MTRAATVFIALALVACSADEQTNPLPVPTSAPKDAGADGDGPKNDAGAKVRTIETRDPYGDVAETENLLWDGDFEWSTPFSDEYGWLYGPPIMYSNLPPIVIGAVCHSGIKCAKLAKNSQLLGLAVSSKTSKLEVSVWAKTAKPTCDKIKVVVTAFDSTSKDPDVVIKPLASAPDSGGWCQLDGITPVRADKANLFITNSTGDVLYVDDAVVRVVSDKKEARGFELLSSSFDEMAEMAEVGAAVARLRVPHDAPPNAARKAFEAWKRR